MSAKLQATEATLHSLTETKDSLHGSNKTYEKSIDTLKSQLHEEMTARKLADHKVETLETGLSAAKNKRVSTFSNLADHKLETLHTGHSAVTRGLTIHTFGCSKNDVPLNLF